MRAWSSSTGSLSLTETFPVSSEMKVNTSLAVRNASNRRRTASLVLSSASIWLPSQNRIVLMCAIRLRRWTLSTMAS